MESYRSGGVQRKRHNRELNLVRSHLLQNDLLLRPENVAEQGKALDVSLQTEVQHLLYINLVEYLLAIFIIFSDIAIMNNLV
jgi:ABC-type dipeptide/oligopeptide/nickel transport system ATPase subunit